LRLDRAGRAQLEEDLLRARVFSDEVNGRPWFHEQRRQLLVHEILEPDERAEACERAVQELLELAQETDSFGRFSEIAVLVPAAQRLLDADEQLAAAVELDRDELAISAAVLELTDPQSPAVLGDALLDYARTTFGGENLIDALQRLGARGLVAVVEEKDAAAVVPYGQAPLVRATMMGRCANELGRMPVPAVARSVFETEVLPRLGPFEMGSYGVGAPSAARLAEEIPKLRQPQSGLIVIGGDLGQNLLIRAQHAGRPLYGAFTFESAERRDQAHADLDGLAAEVLGEPFEITGLHDHPMDPVAARRFVVAAERLTGKNFFVAPKLTLEEPLEPAEAIRRKAEALRVTRALCSPTERLAARLEEPIGLVWHARRDGDGEFFYEIEISGGREGFEELKGGPPLDWDDPYRSLRLAEAIGLGERERIAKTNIRHSHEPSVDDPVMAVIASLRERSTTFNKAQKRRHKVPLKAESLAALLTASARRSLSDAEALAAIPLGDAEPELTPRKTYIVVRLDQPEPGFVTAAHAVADYLWTPDPGGEEDVHVAVVGPDDQRQATAERRREAFKEHFGLELAEHQFISSGVLRHVLASMLGFDYDPLDLELPSP